MKGKNQDGHLPSFHPPLLSGLGARLSSTGGRGAGMSRTKLLLFSNSMIFKERAIAEADWGGGQGAHRVESLHGRLYERRAKNSFGVH